MWCATAAQNGLYSLPSVGQARWPCLLQRGAEGSEEQDMGKEFQLPCCTPGPWQSKCFHLPCFPPAPENTQHLPIFGLCYLCWKCHLPSTPRSTMISLPKSFLTFLLKITVLYILSLHPAEMFFVAVSTTWHYILFLILLLLPGQGCFLLEEQRRGMLYSPTDASVPRTESGQSGQSVKRYFWTKEHIKSES